MSGARPAILNLKIRTPSGAVNVGVKKRERSGVPLTGASRSAPAVCGQVASDERSGPRAAGKSVLLDPSLVYTAFIPVGCCRPSRRRKGHVPRKGNPTPLAPHNGESGASSRPPPSPFLVTRPGAGPNYRPMGGSLPA